MISDIVEQQKKEWLREQYEICSRVILLPDEPQDDGSDSANNLRLRFHKRNLSVSNIGGRYFGGVDVSFPEDDKRPFVAVYVIVDASDDSFPVVYQDSEYFHSEIPYVPSFLAFREIDPLLRLVRKQRRLKPDLTPSAILVDGNGLLHPRGAGIACFLGVRTGIPTIGIGKTLFCEGGLTKEIVARGIDESLVAAAASMTGKLPSSGDSRVQVWTDQRPITGAVDSTDMDKAPRKALLQKIAPHCIGLAVPLQLPLLHNMQQAETIGATKIACALLGHGGRSRGHSKSGIGTISPIFVSVGHKVSMSQAVHVTAFLSRVRIPEPVRQADLIGRRMLRDAGKSIT